MKVWQMLQRLLLVASIYMVAYATASELQQQRQHAEVQTATAKPKFGTKLAQNSTVAAKANVALVPTAVSSVAQPRTAPRIARRYEASAAPTAQLVAQYADIPIVHKTHNSHATNDSRGERQRGNTSLQRANAAVRKSGQPQSAASAAGGRNSNSNLSSVTSMSNATNANGRRSSYSRNGVSSGSRNTSTSSPTNSGGGGGGTTAVKTKSRKPTSTTTTTTTTTTSTHATPVDNNALNNPFNFFSPNFWGFFNPSTPSSTRKPPKKYTPSAQPTTAKEKKLNHQKPRPTSTTPLALHSSTTAVTAAPLRKETTDGPFRIALPTLGFLNNPAQKSNDDIRGEKEKRNSLHTLRERFNCPRESEVRFQLFPKICKIDEDCNVWNRDEICCEIFGAKSCVSGIAKPLEETSHAPILGLIPRKCPTRPLAELWWEVQECETDMDCWPRVCCPDGRRRYCRTSQPELETVPVPVKRSFNYLSEYLECTPPPPPIFDLHPKICASTLDCFPNVCCQESGLRHCRPPKKSVLTLMANFLNVDFVKRLTQNIVIK